MILVGAAYQVGAIPLTAEAIERAITLNGAVVETNLQAFRRGRQVVCDPVAAGEGLPGEHLRPHLRRDHTPRA